MVLFSVFFFSSRGSNRFPLHSSFSFSHSFRITSFWFPYFFSFTCSHSSFSHFRSLIHLFSIFFLMFAVAATAITLLRTKSIKNFAFFFLFFRYIFAHSCSHTRPQTICLLLCAFTIILSSLSINIIIIIITFLFCKFFPRFPFFSPCSFLYFRFVSAFSFMYCY